MKNQNTLPIESNLNLPFLNWKTIWQHAKAFFTQVIFLTAKGADLDLERFEKLEAKKTIHNFLRN